MSLVISSSDHKARPTQEQSPTGPRDSFASDSPEGLTVNVHTEGDYNVITVIGEIDLATAPEFSEVARGLLDAASHVVIDLDQVSFIDSTGLSVLVAIHRRVTSQGGSMVLVCNSARCMRVLEITGLSRLFNFAASTAAAMGGSSAGPGGPGLER